MNGGYYPQAKSWILKEYSSEHPFISSLGIHTKNKKIPKKRTYSLREFWFVDWKKDIAIGFSRRMIDVELETADREGFEIKLLRVDSDGKIDSYIPAMFQLPHTQYVKENEVMSFSGEINTEKPETGHFTFQYCELLSLPEGKAPEDYRWGVEIKAKNDHPVALKKVSLVNDKNEILDSISPEPIPLQNDAVHLAGPIRPFLVLTEGPMKSDVIHALSGLSVLAVPGVNALSTLRETLQELRAKGLREIKTAFDMDFSTNQNVQSGYRNLQALLDEMGFWYGTYIWDPRYKGLDDYILAVQKDAEHT